MGKTKIYVGKIEFDSRKATADQGHEYGKGRGTAIHKHKNRKRERAKLRQELRRYY